MRAFSVECMYCDSVRSLASEERLLAVIDEVLEHSDTCELNYNDDGGQIVLVEEVE